MFVPPPGLLSMTTGTPRISCMPPVSSRAVISAAPPGDAGTIIRIALFGKAASAAVALRKGGALRPIAPANLTSRLREITSRDIMTPVRSDSVGGLYRSRTATLHDWRPNAVHVPGVSLDRPHAATAVAVISTINSGRFNAATVTNVDTG